MRIEGIGVSESVVQKQGNDRIVVQIPGIQDPERARKIAQQQAFLEFKITDKTQALERALPRSIRSSSDKGLATTDASARHAEPAATRRSKGLLDLRTDTAKKPPRRRHSRHAKKDTTAATRSPTGGAFSSLLQQSPSGMPGEFYVESDDASTLEDYLATAAVKAAMPPGKDMLPAPIRRYCRTSRTRRSISSTPSRSSPVSTLDGRPSEQVAARRHDRRVHARQRRRPPLQHETGKHVHDYMAIILDDRVMGRPPVIQSAIGTRGQITMGQGSDLARRAGSRARAARRRASRAASRRGSSQHRSEPRSGLDQQGHSAPAPSPSRSSS